MINDKKKQGKAKVWVVLVGILLFSAIIGFVSADITYTSSTETVCNNGICTKTLYSGIRNVYEDDQWKKVENARSLKNKGFKVNILEDDKDFPIEVIDFNYTSITVKLNPDGLSIFNKDVPIRIWNENITKKEQFLQDVIDGKEVSEGILDYKKEMDNILEEEIGFNLLNQKETKTYNFNIGDILEFGYNSTTIQLQEADTENLEDATFDEDSTRDGTENLLLSDFVDGGGEITFIKFNISSIPSGQQIENATLCLRNYNDVSASNEILEIWRVSNQTWVEGEIDALCGDGVACSDMWNMFTTQIRTYAGIDNLEQWNCISDLHSAVQIDYDAENPATSFTLNNTGDTIDYYQWKSKEHTTTNERPYLNITYSQALDITPPYFTTIPNNESIFYLNETLNVTFVGTDETGFSGYFINDTTNFNMGFGSGFLINNTPLSAGNYAVNVSINDTSNNINWTIFTLEINQSLNPCDIILNDTSPLTFHETLLIHTNCDSSYQIKLNGTNINNNSILDSGVGGYNISVERTDSVNYSNIFDDKIVSVLPSNDNCQVFFNTTSPIVYPEIFTSFTDCSSAYTLYRNGTAITNNSEVNSGANYFNFSVQRTDTINYTNSFDDEFFTVSKATPTGSLTNNETFTETYPTSITIGLSESNSQDGGVTYVVWRDNIDKTTGESVLLGVTTYDYILNTSGGVNYSSASLDTETLTINPSSDDCEVSFNATSPIIYPETFLVWHSCDSTAVLTQNGTTISNNSLVDYGVGGYNYSVLRTDATNYTNIFDDEIFSVLKNGGTLNVLFNETSPIVYPKTFRAYSDSSTPGTLTRNGSTIANNSIINSGAGYYNLSFLRTDNQNYTNIFDDEFFTVNKATTSLSLSGTSPITYGTAGNVEGTNCPGALSCNLYRDGTGVSNPDSSTLSIGSYGYIFNNSLNVNYTSDSETFTLQINGDSSDCDVFFNTTSPIVYPETFTANTNCNTAYNLYLNGSSISNASIVNSGKGAYNISVQRTDVENYTNTFAQEQFIVNGNPGNCQVLFNVSSPHLNTTAFITFTDCTTGFQMYLEGSIIGNNSQQYPLNAGTYNYSVFRNVTGNYSNIFDQVLFVVSSPAAPIPEVPSPHDDFTRVIAQIIQALLVLSAAVIILLLIVSFYEERRTLGEMFSTMLYVGIGTFILILLMPIMVSYIASIIK